MTRCYGRLLAISAGVASLAIAAIVNGCVSQDCNETATCLEPGPDAQPASGNVFEAGDDSSEGGNDDVIATSDDVGVADTAVNEGGFDQVAESATRDVTGLDVGSDIAVDAGSDAGMDADAGTDAEAGVDADAGMDVDAGVDADAGARTDAPPDGPCTLASCGVQSACVIGACTPARRVFVSSATYQGNLGGFAGGDSKCQILATSAGLGGTWRAWISDSSSSPSIRFTQATVAYRLLDGTVIVAGWSALVAGTLAHAINLDETGSAVAGTTQVWTGTTSAGIAVPAGYTCLNFTSNATGDIGVFGLATAIDMTWTFDQSQYCNFAEHLYCFEQ